MASRCRRPEPMPNPTVGSVSYRAPGGPFKLPDALLAGPEPLGMNPRRTANPLPGSELFDLGYDEAFRRGLRHAQSGGAPPGTYDKNGLILP